MSGMRYKIKRPINFVWSLKMLRDRKYNFEHRDPLSVCFWLIWNSVLFTLQMMLTGLGGGNLNIINMFYVIGIWWISMVLSILFWKCICTFFCISSVNTPHITSSYHRRLLSWNTKNNNLSSVGYLKFLFNARTVRKGIGIKVKAENFLRNRIRNIAMLLVPYCTLYESYQESHTDDTMKWVVPDCYDIQHDLSYFIINEIQNIMPENSELMDCIYHILNAVVAHQICTVLRDNKQMNIKMDIPTNIKDSYACCLHEYSRHT